MIGVADNDGLSRAKAGESFASRVDFVVSNSARWVKLTVTIRCFEPVPITEEDLVDTSLYEAKSAPAVQPAGADEDHLGQLKDCLHEPRDKLLPVSEGLLLGIAASIWPGVIGAACR